MIRIRRGEEGRNESSLLSDDVAQACNVEETVAQFCEIVFRLILSSNLANNVVNIFISVK